MSQSDSEILRLATDLINQFAGAAWQTAMTRYREAVDLGAGEEAAKWLRVSTAIQQHAQAAL